jgi:hypothetical protein
MREAEEVEGLRFLVAAVSPAAVRMAAELDEPCLVGMERQPESRDALAQLGEEPVAFRARRKSDDET